MYVSFNIWSISYINILNFQSNESIAIMDLKKINLRNIDQ